MRGKRAAGLALLLLFALGLVIVKTVGRPPGPPRLVVLLVVDQMRFDYLTRFSDLYKGGFRRLLDKGALFTEARYRHALTITAPGHAAIATGLHPSHTGVPVNNWYDSYRKQAVNAVDDPAYGPLGGPGRKASPRPLLAETLGDRLKRRYQNSRVVGVSTKDRAAILMAGRGGDAAYWYSDDCGCFVTSSFYMKQAPAWLRAFNESKPADRYYQKPWKRILDDEQLYEGRSRADAFAGELDKTGTAFPHPLRGKPPEAVYYGDLRRTPYADELTLEAALAAMSFHKLGADETPDLLAISFSATDYVGHDYGPFSQEAMDQQLRLDRLLGRLFAALDERVGLERVVVALTADHGAAPLVSYAQQQGLPAKTVPPHALADAVQAAVAKEYPQLGNVIAYFDPPHLFLDLARLDEQGIPRSRVEALAKEALAATGFVAHVYTHEEMSAAVVAGDRYQQLYRNSFYERRSPHLTVRLKEFYYVDGSQGPTGHGTPYEYDRHVPILLMGPGIHAGKYGKPCGPEDLAPTLAAMLQVKMPVEADARLLREVLR